MTQKLKFLQCELGRDVFLLKLTLRQKEKIIRCRSVTFYFVIQEFLRSLEKILRVCEEFLRLLKYSHFEQFWGGEIDNYLSSLSRHARLHSAHSCPYLVRRD